MILIIEEKRTVILNPYARRIQIQRCLIKITME